ATPPPDTSPKPSARARRAGLPLPARGTFPLPPLRLCIGALSTAAHLYHAQQIVCDATPRAADLRARQLSEQYVRTLRLPAPQRPRDFLSHAPDLRSLLAAAVV